MELVEAVPLSRRDVVIGQHNQLKVMNFLTLNMHISVGKPFLITPIDNGREIESTLPEL